MAGAGGSGRGSTTGMGGTGAVATAAGDAAAAAGRGRGPTSPREGGQARREPSRDAGVGHLRDAEPGDRDERDEQDERADLAQGTAEGARDRPAEPAAAVEPAARHRPRELGEQPRDRQEPEGRADPQRERADGQRAREGREGPDHQDHRHDVRRVADRREQGPPHPEPDDADPRALVDPAQRGIVGEQRDRQVRGEAERDDALGLAEPARRDLRPGLRLRHQASSTIGSTIGFRS